ncbi:MAG: hypothetical protein ABFD54_14230 [Armatimonadota bacterium]|nr:hypothetical protein [bacterium]
MRRVIIATCILIMVCLGLANAAATPGVQQLLPKDNAVKGFKVMPGSLQYGKGEGLTNIYDGGYELYTKNGVIDAARRMYQRKSDYVEVTVHTMKSDKAAMDFLKYWQKENKVKSLTKSKGGASFIVTKPSVMAYGVKGKYFTTISAFYLPDKARQDVKAFLGVVEKNVVRK